MLPCVCCRYAGVSEYHKFVKGHFALKVKWDVVLSWGILGVL